MQFVRQYYAALDAALGGAPTSTLSALYEPGCSICVNDVQMIGTLLANGNHMQGGGYTIVSARSITGGTTDIIPVEIQLNEEVGRLVSKTGAVLRTYTAGSDTVAIDIQAEPSGFKIVEILPE